MKNIESLFDFYIKNRLYTTIEEQSNKFFASIFAIVDPANNRNYDLTKVINMIILDGIDIEKLINKNEIKDILDELYSNQTNESKVAKKCLERAKNMKSDGIENDLSHIYGRILLSVGINIECGLKLDFDRLYERVIKLTTSDLEREKNTRLKYCYYNIYDVTEEYAYLISFIEELINMKINETKEQRDFNEAYEEEKGFYRSMPILNAVLEKTKKL